MARLTQVVRRFRDSRLRSRKVYEFGAAGLGDQCRLVNYLLMHDMRHIALRARRPALAAQMLSLFGADESHDIRARGKDSERGEIINLRNHKLGKYLPMPQGWIADPHSRRILTQLQGAQSRSSSKNTSEADVSRLLQYLTSLGYEAGEVTNDWARPLKMTVDRMIASRLFIGIESGWAHVAHSCGIPCIIIRNDQIPKILNNYHVGNEYTVYENVDELIANFDATLSTYRPNF
jgi:hypothetical protein